MNIVEELKNNKNLSDEQFDNCRKCVLTCFLIKN